MTDPKAEMKPCPDDIREAVAKALHYACYTTDWDGLPDYAREHYRKQAYAAYAAWNTRTPTTGFNAGLEAAIGVVKKYGLAASNEVSMALMASLVMRIQGLKTTATCVDGWRTDWENAPKSNPANGKIVEFLGYGPEVGICFARVWEYNDGEAVRKAVGFNGDYKLTHFMLITPPEATTSDDARTKDNGND